ncbi:FAD-binding domain-containing protein [Sandaracinobacteroides sp. A072]|uniref:FAD-binding domain-containing protein n=1 Tax=Sandaracinobacteroides sp. A072 TaxID=3461146 RepID=UPI0040424598
MEEPPAMRHGAKMDHPATRAEALARLEAFLPRAGRLYAANRNFDEGPGRRTHVSGLSPAIRRRLLCEEEVARAALNAHGFAAAEKFLLEVCWRSYWRGWLEARPLAWQRYCADVARLNEELARAPSLGAAYSAAISGQTGIDCFDFWARELAETGYLHNHARMSFASIWIFTLKLPWQLGADFFYRHLLDACPASNTLGWRWVAGLQTAGKTYLASADTIRRTSCGRFRVDAPLAREAPPLPPEAPIHPAGLPALPEADPDAPSGLFLHTEDLSAETMVFPAPVRAIAGPDRIDGDPADLKRAYANASLDDGIVRAATHFAAEASRLPVDTLPEAVTQWAARHGFRQVLTPCAPVGPVADRLALMGVALARAGIRLVPVRRAWDSAAWPHATRGFFQFKGRIPALLAGGGAG